MDESSLSLQETNPEEYTDAMIQGIVMGGTDTSTLTTEWAMALLLQHPEAMQKARAEIDAHVGTARLVEESDIANLPYLQCVVKETFRLFPVGPILPAHEAMEDCTVGGFHVPRGTMVLVNIWAIQRDPKVWDAPDEFRPERFLVGGAVTTVTAPILTFGSGRRRCPGENLGVRLVSVALAALVQCFEWDVSEGCAIDMAEGAAWLHRLRCYPFYCSYSGYQDELLWAAAWLHRASRGNGTFLSYVRANGLQLGAGDDDFSFSWDDKRAGAKVLLARGFLRRRLAGLELYKAHSDSYICALVPGTATFQPSQYTPGGLISRGGGGGSGMQYVTTATFLLLAYAKYLRSSGTCAVCGGRDVAPAELVALAKRQVDYVLGKNPAATSYMVGFGARFPRRLHHRGASMPSVRAHPARIGCDQGFAYLHSGEDDPNVLVGAVVGGPDARDGFVDDRDSYGQTEPATYINAPLVGALAFFAGTAKQGKY
ncbi:hypothetical protein U9M48_041183 [Paspalum notatum var. saurae]|uniref:Endoglucanase n=1 Tax=Paspalum notatum var. saurae TaxID=547442 RepID=A0AAQ3UNE5_PASNO